jgi:murein DD-endopeptidase MepM/ murein hydrolase activator NlpD
VSARRPSLLGVLALAALAAAGPASAPRASAQPDVGATARASAQPEARATARAFERQDVEGTLGLLTASGTDRSAGPTTMVATSVAGAAARAEATARSEDVTLFDGLVTAESVEVAATTTRWGTRTSGRVRRLRIDGRLVGSPTSKHVYRMAGVGTLAVLSSGRTGIVGLRATLREAYGGLPAGTSVAVAYASARAVDGAAPAPDDPADQPEPSDEAPAPRTQAPRSDRREARKGRARSRPAATARRRPAPRVEALRTERGYAFPVHRGYSYGNDWGAPRQFTGRHQGTDIFAPAGTPVLAVTDGTLNRVGTRAVPGNRLWLRGAHGDTYFYAHLSAFSEGARNGADVRAGDVLGFVGTTGDAERTPPHLHFEIHPEGGDAVNPYPFVRAWEERRDVPPAAWLTRYGEDPTARPGVLVVVEDYLAG